MSEEMKENSQDQKQKPLSYLDAVMIKNPFGNDFENQTEENLLKIVRTVKKALKDSYLSQISPALKNIKSFRDKEYRSTMKVYNSFSKQSKKICDIIETNIKKFEDLNSKITAGSQKFIDEDIPVPDKNLEDAVKKLETMKKELASTSDGKSSTLYFSVLTAKKINDSLDDLKTEFKHLKLPKQLINLVIPLDKCIKETGSDIVNRVSSTFDAFCQIFREKFDSSLKNYKKSKKKLMKEADEYKKRIDSYKNDIENFETQSSDKQKHIKELEKLLRERRSILNEIKSAKERLIKDGVDFKEDKELKSVSQNIDEAIVSEEENTNALKVFPMKFSLTGFKPESCEKPHVADFEITTDGKLINVPGPFTKEDVYSKKVHTPPEDAELWFYDKTSTKEHFASVNESSRDFKKLINIKDTIIKTNELIKKFNNADRGILKKNQEIKPTDTHQILKALELTINNVNNSIEDCKKEIDNINKTIESQTDDIKKEFKNTFRIGEKTLEEVLECKNSNDAIEKTSFNSNTRKLIDQISKNISDIENNHTAKSQIFKSSLDSVNFHSPAATEFLKIKNIEKIMQYATRKNNNKVYNLSKKKDIDSLKKFLNDQKKQHSTQLEKLIKKREHICNILEKASRDLQEKSEKFRKSLKKDYQGMENTINELTPTNTESTSKCVKDCLTKDKIRLTDVVKLVYYLDASFQKYLYYE